MPSIEIDFEAYKALTNLREREEVTYNDVIRRLLKLREEKSADAPPPAIGAGADRGAWISKGVRFPSGTEFRANYKGNEHRGVVKDGSLIVDGRKVASPSDAARVVTNTSVNGWNFWECRLPGETRWMPIKALRSLR